MVKLTEGVTAVHSNAGRHQTLPELLKALRVATWPGRQVTQSQLAQAFSTEQSTSGPLISSWESTKNPTMPPQHRLEPYARFFATRRSIDNDTPRLLRLSDLMESERTRYNELLADLTALWSPTADAPANGGGLPSKVWRFADGFDVLIVCAPLPEDVLHPIRAYTDRTSPDYVEQYTYADPDALIELFGHLRAVNPHSDVTFKTADRLEKDDYAKHLVLLGGVDWNPVTRALLNRVQLPVRQTTRRNTDDPGGFATTDPDGGQVFKPVLRDGALSEDVAHFYRGPNPFNITRTVTICNGMFGRGTYAAVRALTDIRFRERNDKYASHRLENELRAFSVLMRVEIVEGDVLTPDWNLAGTRLHEWPEVGQ
jgi:hypothetical protein